MVETASGSVSVKCETNESSDTPVHSNLFERPHLPWWKVQGLRSLNFRLLIIFLSPMIIGYESSLTASLLSMPHWYRDLGVDRDDGNLLGLMGAGYSFGAMIAFPVSSRIADKWGRRVMIVVGDIICIGAVMGQIFWFDARGYVVTRVILGIGSMLVISSCPVLLTELAHPRHRSLVVGSYASLFFVGSTFSAWVSFGTLHIPSQWSWRIPTILQLLPAATQLCLMRFVPESPRWLISQNRHSEAREILVRFHADGNPHEDVVLVQYSEMCNAIELNHQKKAPSWMSWLRGAENRRRLLLIVSSTIFGSWSGNSIITLYLPIALRKVGIHEPAQQTTINGCLQIFNTCVSILGASIVDRLGRRCLFITSSVIMLFSMIGFTVTTKLFVDEGNSASGKALVAMVFVFQLGSNIGFTPLTVLYIAEICTYYLRAKAMSLHYLLSYGFSAANQYANPVALQNMGWKYYSVYIGILVVEVIFVYFVLPETKGLTVEEVSHIFEK